MHLYFLLLYKRKLKHSIHKHCYLDEVICAVMTWQWSCKLGFHPYNWPVQSQAWPSCQSAPIPLYMKFLASLLVSCHIIHLYRIQWCQHMVQ